MLGGAGGGRGGWELGAVTGFWSLGSRRPYLAGCEGAFCSFSTLLSSPGDAQDCGRGGEIVGSGQDLRGFLRKLATPCSSWLSSDERELVRNAGSWAPTQTC